MYECVRAWLCMHKCAYIWLRACMCVCVMCEQEFSHNKCQMYVIDKITTILITKQQQNHGDKNSI